MVAAAKTMVSPRRMVTAPPAWAANLPVSIVTGLPPIRAVYCLTTGFIESFSFMLLNPPGQGLKTGEDHRSRPTCPNQFSIPNRQGGDRLEAKIAFISSL